MSTLSFAAGHLPPPVIPASIPAQMHLDFALRLESRPPAPVTPAKAVKVADEVADLVHEGGFPIPAYRDFRAQYSRQEWREIIEQLKPSGAVTHVNCERWVGLAKQTDDNLDPLSDRHFIQISQRHAARVMRHLRACDADHDRTQDSLRLVLQREYVPAHNRITSLAKAVGDGLDHKTPTEIRDAIGDLPEAAPFVHENLNRWGGKPPAWAKDLRQRADRQIARELVEVLEPYFRAGGTTYDASLTRVIRRELANEGYNFFRSGRFNFLKHPLYNRADSSGTTQESCLQRLVAYGRRQGQESISWEDLKGLREEVALTVRHFDVQLGAKSLARDTTAVETLNLRPVGRGSREVTQCLVLRFVNN